MQQPNTQNLLEITADQLPLHCPLPGSSLWNSHPRVYIPLEEVSVASCPYCGTRFHRVDTPAAGADAGGVGAGTTDHDPYG